MAQAESRLSTRILARLRLEGWFCFKVHGSELMMAGLPDIVVCAEGLFVGLETKMPAKRNNTSVRQDHVHGQIVESGGAVFVVCSPEEAVRVVQSVLDGRSRTP